MFGNYFFCFECWSGILLSLVRCFLLCVCTSKWWCACTKLCLICLFLYTGWNFFGWLPHTTAHQFRWSMTALHTAGISNPSILFIQECLVISTASTISHCDDAGDPLLKISIFCKSTLWPVFQGMADHCWIFQNGLIFSCIFRWPIYASFVLGDCNVKLSSRLIYVNFRAVFALCFLNAVSCPIRWKCVLQPHQYWRRVFSCWNATLMLVEKSTLLLDSDVPVLYGITNFPTHSLVSLACRTSAFLSCLLIRVGG